MASKELFAQVEQIIWRDRARVIPSSSTDLANKVLATILSALQEPTEGMDVAAYKMMLGPTATRQIWSGLLNASPLGEQSE